MRSPSQKPAAYTPTRADAMTDVAAASRPDVPILIGTRPQGLTARAPTGKKRLIGGSS